MKKRTKRKKVDPYAGLLDSCRDPGAAGSLGGVARFAKARHLPAAKVREILKGDLGYTLHQPTRRRFPTLPVLVMGMDEQWTADLIEVETLPETIAGTGIC